MHPIQTDPERPASVRPFILGFAGPCGSGKSTLAELFASQPHVGLVREPVFPDLLDAFQAAPAQHGWKLQSEILSAKVQNVIELRSRRDVQIIALDRILLEDREIFLELHRTLGFISPEERNQLRDLSLQGEAIVGQPDAVVYVSAPPGLLRRRVTRDGRPAWLVDALDLHLSLYDGFQDGLTVPAVRVETDSITQADLPAVAAWIYETISGAARGTVTGNETYGLMWSMPLRHLIGPAAPPD